jgi:hypothetical protein
MGEAKSNKYKAQRDDEGEECEYYVYFVSWTVHSLMMRRITNRMH